MDPFGVDVSTEHPSRGSDPFKSKEAARLVATLVASVLAQERVLPSTDSLRSQRVTLVPAALRTTLFARSELATRARAHFCNCKISTSSFCYCRFSSIPVDVNLFANLMMARTTVALARPPTSLSGVSVVLPCADGAHAPQTTFHWSSDEMAPHITSKTSMLKVTEHSSPPDERAWYAHSFVLFSPLLDASNAVEARRAAACRRKPLAAARSQLDGIRRLRSSSQQGSEALCCHRGREKLLPRLAWLANRRLRALIHAP
jgi:hypothetical protein